MKALAKGAEPRTPLAQGRLEFRSGARVYQK